MVDKNVNKTKEMVYAALFLALALLLPFLTANNRELGNIICIMHFPIFLAAYLIDYRYSMMVGFIAPLLRSFIFGMPQMIPTAISMAFELLTYACVCGILYRAFKKKVWGIYISLLVSMVVGRVVSGIVKAIIMGANGSKLTFDVFFATNVIKTLPGIGLQIIIIPLLVMTLRKAKFTK